MINNTLIIDYTLGNLQSVYNAIEAVDGKPNIVKEPARLQDASHVILPGVGSFKNGMDGLIEYGWIEYIESYIKSGRPFLGICLGMQLLATTGNEHGKHKGLNIIEGNVDRLEPGDASLRIPHIGWNDVSFLDSGELSKGMQEKEDFYFVHSYAFTPKEKNCVKGTCHYDGPFAAILEYENIYAVQFHPEKSQKAGLGLLRNFITLD